MQKILIIFSGGTISSSSPDKNGIVSLSAKAKYHLLEHYRENFSQDKSIIFEYIEPLQTLSENMTVSKWNTLIDTLKTTNLDDKAGIIITHGSDTLAYSAALFSLLLEGIKIPVVFVASNYNLSDPKANGHNNFKNAVDFICTSNKTGVHVIYEDNLLKNHIYKGSEITQCQAFTDQFNAYSGPQSVLALKSTLLLWKIKELRDCVLQITPYPGLRYDCFNLKNTKAILHGTYHSFTTCIENPESPSSILYLKNICDKMGIPILLAPFSHKDYRYSSTDTLLKNGFSTLPDMSTEYAYAKLLVEYAIKV